jgi:translation elongation factor EF-G
MEPIMKVEIQTIEDYTGAVTADINNEEESSSRLMKRKKNFHGRSSFGFYFRIYF